MNTLIIFKVSDGKVVSTLDNVDFEEFDFISYDIPNDKNLISVDPVTKDPVLEDKPKDAMALLNELKNKLEQQEEMSGELESALYNLADVISSIVDGSES